MNIESIQPELAAFELDRIVREEGDATATAALTALLHDVTGCDIPQTSDLPESEVEELVPLCVSILRRHWTTPLTALGDGTTPMSLSDLLRQSIGDRVQGNEALGIPAANANIPAALTALRNRDMSSGLTLTLSDGTTTQAPDGISLAQLLCTTLADTITELKDDNVGWVLSPSKMRQMTPLFANTRKATLQCRGTLELSTIQNLEHLEELSIPFIEGANVSSAGSDSATGATGCIRNLTALKKLYAPKLSNATWGGNGNQYSAIITGCTELQEAWIGKVTNSNYPGWGGSKWVIQYCENLQYLHVEGFVTNNCTVRSGQNNNLVLIEICKEQAESCNLNWWNPTTALAERLDEFLANFKTYIAHRLTDQGSGLTLTLSPAVRDAIQTDPEIVSIITSKGWTISPAPSV